MANSGPIPRSAALTSIPALGRLTRVDARTVCVNRARDLAPWLLANADHLAEALGIELEITTAEHPVGGFSLDLIGRDLSHDAVLIVEHELEGSDRSHLGQLLTYVAGTGAATTVWLATNFREEHRQALDWLNEHRPRRPLLRHTDRGRQDSRVATCSRPERPVAT